MRTFATRASWVAAAGVVAAGLGTLLVGRQGDRSLRSQTVLTPPPAVSIAEPRVEAELTPFSTAPREARVFGANEVDARALIVTRDRTPAYPDSLRNKRQEGSVLARFVVGQNGRVDLSSFQAERSTDALFTDAVKTYLAQTRFAPAVIRGRAVAQLVRMPFTFNLTGLGSSVSYGMVSNVANADDDVVMFDGGNWVVSGGGTDFIQVKLNNADFQPAFLKGEYIEEMSGTGEYKTTRIIRDGVSETMMIMESKPSIKIKSLKDTLLQQYEYEIQRRK
jgi:TonB family protein